MAQFPKRARLVLRENEILEIVVQPGFVSIARKRGKRISNLAIIEVERDVLMRALRWLIPIVRRMPSSVDPISTLIEQEFIDDSQARARRQRRRNPPKRRRK